MSLSVSLQSAPIWASLIIDIIPGLDVMYTKTESEVSVQNKMGGVSEKQNLENKVILKLYI